MPNYWHASWVSYSGHLAANQPLLKTTQGALLLQIPVRHWIRSRSPVWVTDREFDRLLDAKHCTVVYKTNNPWGMCSLHAFDMFCQMMLCCAVAKVEPGQRFVSDDPTHFFFFLHVWKVSLNMAKCLHSCPHYFHSCLFSSIVCEIDRASSVLTVPDQSAAMTC